MSNEELLSDRDQRVGEVLAAYLEALDSGWAPSRAGFLARYPDLAEELHAFFANQDQVQYLAEPLRVGASVNAPGDGKEELPYAASGPTVSLTDTAVTPQEPAPQWRFGDYELLEEIARGGMGVVYRARQISLNRQVALKMILGGQLASSADVQRLYREAKAAAQMDHPNIVPIHEIGEYDGQHYFTMKLIEGGNLDEHLDRYADDPRAAVRLVVTIGLAVHYAHQRGILHRDLKPANILLDDRGNPHITDFGLAKQVEGDPGLTQSGAIVGSPSYMAPEQASRKKVVLTTAVDVHSLGSILYTLLTGQPPFRAETIMDTLMHVRESMPERPRVRNPRIDLDLETICLKCLEKEPANRYGSAQALAEDLERWLAHEPILARRATVWERLWKWTRRRPLLAAAACLMALLVGLGSTVFAVIAIGSWRTSAVTGQKQARAAQIQAEEAKIEALEARKEVEREVQAKAEWETKAEQALYMHHIALAERDLATNNHASARLQLQECPENLRNFEWSYLNLQCQGNKAVTDKYLATERTLANSPDGRYVLSYNPYFALQVQDATSGKPVQVLEGIPQPVQTAAFSTDGQKVAVTSGDQVVRVWDARSGQQYKSLTGHRGKVSSVVFSPDGSRIASASIDDTVKIWDATTGKELQTLRGERGSIRNLTFSPNGRYIALATDDRTIKVWDAQQSKDSEIRPVSLGGPTSAKDSDAPSGKEVRTIAALTAPAQCVAFSPDGTQIAAGTGLPEKPGEVKIWTVATGQPVMTLKGRALSVQSMAFSPDGKRLVTAGKLPGNASEVKLWDIVTGRELLTLTGARGGVRSVAFSPDGRRITAVTEAGAVQAWDTAPKDEGKK